MNYSEQAKNIFGKHAQSYADKYWDVSKYDASFKYFLDKLPENSELIELGCGPGNVSEYLLKQRVDLNLTGLDISDEMVDIARKKVPAAQFIVADCAKLDPFDKNFDSLVAAFCFPYLSQEAVFEIIDNIANSNIRSVYLSTMIEEKYRVEHFNLSSDGKDSMTSFYHDKKAIADRFMEKGFVLSYDEEMEGESGQQEVLEWIGVFWKR